VSPDGALGAVWREESARLIAGLTRLVGDVGTAEDLAQEAFVAALETWPRTGVPDVPGAWLTTVAKRRALDHLRRRRTLGEKLEALGRDPTRDVDDDPSDLDDVLGDDVLALVFTCCHPVLAREARVALTLRMLGGLTTEEIARAFLVPVPTVGQRISRAKARLADEAVPFAVPEGDELGERLGSVLEVVYLIFNEGYAATAGDDWMRPALCEDALRLARLLADLAPDEPEVHGLLALLELQHARAAARLDDAGRPVALLDQDRDRWDLAGIGRGLRALDRAGDGPYGLQAQIAACHLRARRAQDTDWPRIAELYEALAILTRSSVVELNRAVAIGMAGDPGPALELLEAVAPALPGLHLVPAVRGDLLRKLDR
jgi:RNA polymerase sigma-70 factor, ECF subfamily